MYSYLLPDLLSNMRHRATDSVLRGNIASSRLSVSLQYCTLLILSFLCSLVALTLSPTALAQSPPKHAHKPSRLMPLKNIRQVDFQNFTYQVNDETLRVSNGRGVYASNGQETFSYSIEKVAVAYGDLTGDGTDEAAVTLYYTGGGTGAFSKGFVFTLRAGHLFLLTTFAGGDRADGGIREVQIKDGLLWVQRNEPERLQDAPVGLCCPKYIITTRYKWDGRTLNQVGAAQKVELVVNAPL
jgi:hypothetical protein